MVMEEVRRTERHTHHHTETITRRELEDRLPEFLDEADLPPDEPVDVTHDDQGNITVTPHKSRWEKFIGSMPGLSEHMDLEADRSRWAERDRQLGIGSDDAE